MEETEDVCEIISKMKIIVTTAKDRKSGTDDPIKLYIGEHDWELDHPFCDDFEKGRIDEFDLDIPQGFTSDWFQFLCIKKERDIKSDNWKLQRVVVEINDRVIYDSGDIEYWFKPGQSTWCAKDFVYGKCRGNVSPDFDIKK
ncbi:MAG: hypothetical protein FK733_09925 [Asgard group archaeon]|nr:hypothetical protein [Asgard group archaeon]